MKFIQVEYIKVCHITEVCQHKSVSWRMCMIQDGKDR